MRDKKNNLMEKEKADQQLKEVKSWLRGLNRRLLFFSFFFSFFFLFLKKI